MKTNTNIIFQLILMVLAITSLLVHPFIALICQFALGFLQLSSALMKVLFIKSYSKKIRQKLIGYVGMVLFWAFLFLLPVTHSGVVVALWLVVIPWGLAFYFLYLEFSVENERNQRSSFLPHLEFD